MERLVLRTYWPEELDFLIESVGYNNCTYFFADRYRFEGSFSETMSFWDGFGAEKVLDNHLGPWRKFWIFWLHGYVRPKCNLLANKIDTFMYVQHKNFSSP